MTAPNGRLRVAKLVTVGAGVLSVMLSCNPQLVIDPFQDPQPLLDIPECPHTWEIRQYNSPPQEILIGVAGRTTNVPEYHDCQRLVTKSGYGPLVAAFASERLEQLGPSLRSTQGAKRALVAVELWNVDSVPYGPLQITPGFSCLYVELQGTAWRGKLVRYGWPQPDCTQPVDLNALIGLNLSVVPRPTSSTDFQREDFPPVVRWEWDKTNNHQYLGFKCDVALWCEAGLDGFVSADQLTSDPAASREQRRTLEIRGWLDTQQLAEYPAGPNQLATPSAVRGTVIPHFGLRNKTFTDFQNRWVQVAYVVLDAESETYTNKLNFVPTNASNMALSADNTTTVLMCWAGAGSCPGAPANTVCPATTGSVGTGVWWAMFTAPNREPIYKCVGYRAHPQATPTTAGRHTIGTARWRWIANDETIWIGCPDGCCYSGDT